MKNIEYRMYGLVPGNISNIQAGIQFGHGVVEYAQKHFNDPEYQHWAKHHKTFIILNGGTSNHTLNRYTQKNKEDYLVENGTICPGWSYVDYDNGDARCYDRVSYERDSRIYLGTMEQHLKTLEDAGIEIATFYEPDLNDMLSAIIFLVPEEVFNKKDYPEPEYLSEYSNDKVYQMSLDSELKELIGEENFFLRRFLSQFRLA